MARGVREGGGRETESRRVLRLLQLPHPRVRSLDAGKFWQRHHVREAPK